MQVLLFFWGGLVEGLVGTLISLWLEIECLKDLVTMRTTILTTVCLNDIETKQTLCTQINGEMFFPASEKGNADSQSSQKTWRELK